MPIRGKRPAAPPSIGTQGCVELANGSRESRAGRCGGDVPAACRSIAYNWTMRRSASSATGLPLAACAWKNLRRVCALCGAWHRRNNAATTTQVSANYLGRPGTIVVARIKHDH